MLLQAELLSLPHSASVSLFCRLLEVFLKHSYNLVPLKRLWSLLLLGHRKHIWAVSALLVIDATSPWTREKGRASLFQRMFHPFSAWWEYSYRKPIILVFALHGYYIWFSTLSYSSDHSVTRWCPVRRRLLCLYTQFVPCLQRDTETNAEQISFNWTSQKRQKL